MAIIPEAFVEKFDEGLEFTALVIWDVFRSMIRLGANLTCIAIKDSLEPSLTKTLSYFFGLIFAVLSSFIFYNVISGILTTAFKLFFYPILIALLVALFFGVSGISIIIACLFSLYNSAEGRRQGMFNTTGNGGVSGPAGDLGGGARSTASISAHAQTPPAGTGEAGPAHVHWPQDLNLAPADRPANQTQSEVDTALSLPLLPVVHITGRTGLASGNIRSNVPGNVPGNATSTRTRPSGAVGRTYFTRTHNPDSPEVQLSRNSGHLVSESGTVLD